MVSPPSQGRRLFFRSAADSLCTHVNFIEVGFPFWRENNRRKRCLLFPPSTLSCKKKEELACEIISSAMTHHHTGIKIWYWQWKAVKVEVQRLLFASCPLWSELLIQKTIYRKDKIFNSGFPVLLLSYYCLINSKVCAQYHRWLGRISGWACGYTGWLGGHFPCQISDIQVNGQSDDMTAKEKLLLWSQRMVEGNQGLRCDNFTNSWRDGRLFNAILHKLRWDVHCQRFSLKRRQRLFVE